MWQQMKSQSLNQKILEFGFLFILPFQAISVKVEKT